MKSRGIIIVISVLALFMLAALLMNLHYSRVLKKLQDTENSKGFAVVELFTSEGCSSCLPADELIEKIQRDNKNKEIYIMAFHVDYWDHQGWKDTFSNPDYSDRQKQYASWLKLKILYTPQFVINGISEYVGSDEGNILSDISKGLNAMSESSLKLNVTVEDNRIYIDYQLLIKDHLIKDQNTEMVLALIQKNAQSSIKAGENSGRKLTHVQIVRQLRRIDINHQGNLFMSPPDDFKKDGWELIGFIQRKTDGRILAATRVAF